MKLKSIALNVRMSSGLLATVIERLSIRSSDYRTEEIGEKCESFLEKLQIDDFVQ